MKSVLAATFIPCLAAAYFLGACDGSGSGPAAPHDPAQIKSNSTGAKGKPDGRTRTGTFTWHAK
jgi:hypothetical protein